MIQTPPVSTVSQHARPSMPVPRWVFWDNDGVLVDTERLYMEANRLIFAELDEPLDEERYRELFLRHAHGLQKVLGVRGFSPEAIETWRCRRNACYHDLLGRAQDLLLPHAQSVLATIGRTCRMAIVSSTLRRHFDQVHQRTGIPSHMAFVVTAEDCTRFKPDPQPYQIALRRAGIAAADAVVVEDSERGLRAAQAAGLACIMVPHALTRGDHFDGALAVLDSLQDIPRVLGLA